MSSIKPTYIDSINGLPKPLTATANGQLLVGNNSSGNFDTAVITGTNGITVTNGPGTINVAATGTNAIRLAVTTGSQTITANNQTITPTTTLWMLTPSPSNPSSNFNAPAANPINFAGAVAGQCLTIMTTIGNLGSVTLTRGVGLALGAASRKLSGGGSLTLIYDGTQWVETAFLTAATL